ncbi:tetratricopeptide repeat protein [Caldibacillus debilis]|uniref:tetratricopeptide repeat protein n=1 Tax=Caldibacillus debilis TaxID=301148 RepID=UPI000EA94537
MILLHIGKRLLYLRKKNSLSLEQAAQGIVSSTHLSNIENGRFQPSDEILQLLAKKYNVPEKYLLAYDKKDPQIDQPLKEVLFFLITDKTAEAETRLKKVREKGFIPHLEQELEYNILHTCMLVKKNLPYEEELEKLNLLVSGDELEYPSYVHQCYAYLMEQISFRQGDFEKCYHYIQIFLKYNLPPSVYATIQFHLLIILFHLRKRILAVKQAEKGLKIFFQNHQWKFVTETYNILLAIYWTEEDYETALNYGKKALELAETFKFEDTKSRVYHNLGITYKSLKMYETAEEMLAKSIELHRKANQFPRNSLWSILDMFAEIDDKEKFAHWYQQVEPDDEEFFYLYVKMNPDKIGEYLDKLDKLAQKAEKDGRWDLAVEAYHLLSKYFYKNRKYKTAIRYYQKIICIHERDKKTLWKKIGFTVPLSFFAFAIPH